MRRPLCAATLLLLATVAGAATAQRPDAGADPIGLMLAAPGLTQPQRIQLAHSLGAAYYRPASAIFLDRWSGRCAECTLATQAGLALVLSVSTGRTGRSPARPPADLLAYRAQLANVLARVRPAVLSVENEENSRLFYAGTPEEYGVELRAACDVAHARGIRCTNGGLVSKLVALLVYDDFLRGGQADRARAFARRVFTPAELGALDRPLAREQLERGRRLVAEYRAAPVDYVNFHWYIADPAALGEAVAYLRRVTGKPVMTNEIGQQDLDAGTVRALLSAVIELKLPIAVWYSIDSPLARALMAPSGALRPAGEAFREFMRSHGWAR